MSIPFISGLNRVLYVKALVGTFNQEKALVRAFSVIVQLRRLIVYSTTLQSLLASGSWPSLTAAVLAYLCIYLQTRHLHPENNLLSYCWLLAMHYSQATSIGPLAPGPMFNDDGLSVLRINTAWHRQNIRAQDGENYLG